MLNSSNVIAFVATTNAEKARAFYEGHLGLTLLEDNPFALVFDANGVMLRVQKGPGRSCSFAYAILGARQ